MPFNRIQYHQYRWKALQTEFFHLYFPVGYDSLADFTSTHFLDITEELKRKTGVSLQHIPNLIIYPSIDQSMESNIGRNEFKFQKFPTIHLQGSRMAIPFNGSYETFHQQLKEAVSRMLWEEVFNDHELAEQLGNKKRSIPEWYKEGIIIFFAEHWPLEKEALLKTVFENSKPGSWEELLASAPALTGQAFNYYLELQYRSDAGKQIVFQLKSGKSLPRAVRLITKRTLDSLTSQCFSFYQQRFSLSKRELINDSLKEMISIRYPKEKVMQLLSINGEKSIIYVSERNGERTVYMESALFSVSKRKKVSSYILAPWVMDHSDNQYPMIHWAEKENMLFVVMPEKGIINVKNYNISGSLLSSRKLYGIDGVTAFQVIDAQKWLLAAYRKGKSDIVLYDAQRLKYFPVTDDLADNTELSLFSQGTEVAIAYRSGFPKLDFKKEDSFSKDYGVYFKKIDRNFKDAVKENETLMKSDSGYLQWKQPMLINQHVIALRNSQRGFLNTDTFSISGNILTQVNPLNASIPSVWLEEHLAAQKRMDSLALIEEKLKEKETSVLGKILVPKDAKLTAAKRKDSMRKSVAYEPKKVKPYLLQLHTAYFSASINNDYYINRYQPFQSYLGSFKFPEVGAMVHSGLSDLFENHHFNIGYRMPTSSEGSDFFFRYEHTARRLDWSILFFRKVESIQGDPHADWKDENGRIYPLAAKVKTFYYELGFHYPFTYDLSLNFQTAIRKDQTVFLATDRYSLNFEDLKQIWNINTLALSMNRREPLETPFLEKGWSGKIMIDGMATMEKPSTLLYGTQLQFKWHQPLFKNINVVTGIQAGYSSGQHQILYNLGGVDNNISPLMDSTVHYSQDAPYAFQTLITPFRGYPQNSLYGNAYGLVNMDVYVPLFPNLIPLRTSFSFINNVQLGVFTDVATASATELGQHSRTLYAYGFSARTMLAGYPIRFDLAWPEHFSRQPVWYLSLSL